MATPALAKKIVFHIILWAIIGIVTLLIVELSLRAYRSLTYDGGLYLFGTSPNYELHEKYGWISKQNFSHKKNNAFYGKGVARYNEQGFRARPLKEATNADFKVVILGDSYMQAHQIPDGLILPHLLETALNSRFKNPYVLPLAVGGYGSLQQYMLYKDFGEPFEPDLIIQQWCGNDVINNSYWAEYYNFGNNNVLRRPYLEADSIIYRRPYAIHISNWIDNLVLTKVINLLLAKRYANKIGQQELRKYVQTGWNVADKLTTKLIQEQKAPFIALVSYDELKAIDMYQKNDAIIATYSVPDQYKNLPIDNHFNGEGHQILLNSLLPIIDTLIAKNQFHD